MPRIKSLTSMKYHSFARQTLNYLSRPHEQMSASKISSPAAWMGKDLAQQNDWRHVLSSAQRESIVTGVKRLLSVNKPLQSLRKHDLPLFGLEGMLEKARYELEHGTGVQLISGVPVSELGEAGSALFFWCLGLYLGRPGAQNPQGDLLGHVIDRRDAGSLQQRLYQTNKTIDFHCDAADVVGLLCLRKAKRGGSSRIVSSVTVFNQLVELNPALARRLFEPFHLDLRGEAAISTLPIEPCRYYRGSLRTFFHGDYYRSAFSYRHVPAMTDLERELLDAYERIAHDEDNCLDMDLRPGDIQLISNHSVLHARSGYEDYVDVAARRHLLRLWLSFDSPTDFGFRLMKQKAALQILGRRIKAAMLQY